MEAQASTLAEVQKQMLAVIVDLSDEVLQTALPHPILGPSPDFTRIVATEDEEEYWRCNHCYHPLIWCPDQRKPKGHLQRNPSLFFGPRCFENGELEMAHNKLRLAQGKTLAQTFEELAAEELEMAGID